VSGPDAGQRLPQPRPHAPLLRLISVVGTHSSMATGMYYLRTRPKADAIQFTVDKTQVKGSTGTKDAENKATPQEEVEVEDEGECLTCSA
jgi:hypothetical protein